jgi:hypothetical protein
MAENLRDQRRVFNTRNNAQSAAAFGTGLDIDGKYALKTLHP